MTAQQVEAVVGAGAIKIMEWFVDGFFLDTFVKRSKHILHRVFCEIGIAEYSKTSEVDDFKIVAEMSLFDRHAKSSIVPCCRGVGMRDLPIDLLL